MLRVFQRRILRVSYGPANDSGIWSARYSNELYTVYREVDTVSYGPANDSGIWSARYSNELYTVYREVDTVRVVKIGTLKWLGQLCGMQELDHCRTFTVLKPEGARLL